MVYSDAYVGLKVRSANIKEFKKESKVRVNTLGPHTLLNLRLQIIESWTYKLKTSLL